jgi:ABC-2 type transport system permease protein
MLKTVIVKELRMCLRMPAIYVVWLVLCMLLCAALITAQRSRTMSMHEQQQAAATFRHQWESLDVDNAHGAAHYGTYVFRPLSLLYSFDKGVTDFTGNVYRIEAHKQHGFLAPPLPVAGSYMRFGSLTVATILQLLLPLFVIFLCFDIYTRERELGTLSLLQLQGAGNGLLLAGKAVTAILIAGFLLTTGWLVLVPLFVVQQDTQHVNADRLTGLLLAYFMYVSFFALLSIMISFAAKRSGAALLILLTVWLMTGILLPRVISVVSAGSVQLPSHFAVQKKMSDAEKFGLDGKSPRTARQQRFNDSLLKKYQVDSLPQLPVNAAALWMQATEDYNELIYETYMGDVDSLIQVQNSYEKYAKWINPFIALREISMALSGTDLTEVMHFQRAARIYRNDFIRQLNRKLALGGKATPEFYRQMRPFVYIPSTVYSIYKRLIPAYLALAVWLLIPIAGLFFLNRRKTILS